MFFPRRKTYSLQNTSTKTDANHSVYRGFLLALLSGFFYSTASVIVKQLYNIHPGQLSLYRFVAFFTLALPEAVYKCEENLLGPRDMRLLLVLRGIFGATCSFTSYISFRYLPLGESAVIIFSLPVFVTIAARVILKEPCGYFQGVLVSVAVIGIVLTSRVPLLLAGSSGIYSKEAIWGLVASFISLFANTSQCIVIRKLQGVHHSVIMLHYAWIAVIECAVLTVLVGGVFRWHNCGLEAFFVVLLSVISYGSQTLITMALLCEMAGPVCTIISAVDILLAFVWQTLLFRDIPDVYSCAGATLVVLSVLFVAMKKWVSALPAGSACSQKLSFMLK